MKNFLLRLFTGVLYVGIIIASLFTTPVVFYCIFLLIMLFALHEFYSIIKIKRLSSQNVLGSIIAISIFSISYFKMQLGLDIQIAPIIIIFLLLLFTIELFGNSKAPFHAIAFTILGIVYVAIPFGLLPYLAIKEPNQLFLQSRLVFSLFVIIWANDTFAYLWGMALGKHLLIPRISPKKTIEGFVGGLITTLAFAVLISKYFCQDLTMIQWIGAALVIVVFATLGDLTESKLKRYLEIKDSGKMLPGHGGFLDRFDSVIFCIPAFFAYLQLITL